jgi:hypothetical protein
MKRFVSLLILLLVFSIKFTNAQPDTIWGEKQALVQEIQWHHNYHQTLVMKLFLSQALCDDKYKRMDNGKSEVFCTIEEALEIIKKTDNLTLGIPKIIYLVGWQYNGHDSKYPAWFEGNEKLKRPQDANALESIKWLMEEAKKYHTTVSLHINMFDAYEDSPLWETYVKNDIIAKNSDGSLRKGEWGWPISYAQEWYTGFAQKRIDSLCALLPVQEAGTIHIDAFHSWAPIGEKGPGKIPYIKGPISPYLDFTVADETDAQRNIFKYWASKGIDVTSEGVKFLRETSFEGYQPMAWWIDFGLEDYLNWPASYYTGGTDSGKFGKLFGTSMHGEDIFKNDPEKLTGFLKEFYLSTLPWYFLNRLDRLYFTYSPDANAVSFSENVQTRMEGKNFSLLQEGEKYMENGDVFLPARWLKDPAIIAFSDLGYEVKEWSLPLEFRQFKEFSIYKITTTGKQFFNKITSDNGKLVLSLKPGQGVVLIPVQLQ